LYESVEQCERAVQRHSVDAESCPVLQRLERKAGAARSRRT
jgi:aminoglycoside phosphotransferase